VIEIILGFTLGYGVPMFLLKRYIARKRRERERAAPASERRQPELDSTSRPLHPALADRP
jgi:hypothetical protein